MSISRRPIRDLDLRGFERSASIGSGIAVARRGEEIEVATQGLQGVSFMFDLGLSAEPEPPKDRHGRAPSLYDVLDHEKRRDRGKQRPASIDQGAQSESGQDHCGEVDFQRSFDVPFMIERFEPQVDCACFGIGEQSDFVGSLRLNSFVNLVGRVLRHTMSCALSHRVSFLVSEWDY